MIEVLKFIFQDFWHWLGSFILLATIAEGVGGMFKRVTINKREGE